jgi:hypothetical protein
MLNICAMPQRRAVHLGDVVQMRKPHACGANEWTVVRTGADIRLRCLQCGRTVLMPRAKFNRALRKLLTPGSSDPQPRRGSLSG